MPGFACDSKPYPCNDTINPELPYYCAKHAREAGLPCHPDAHGVIIRGPLRLVARTPDFRFDPAAEPGRRFAPLVRQGIPEEGPLPPVAPDGEGREGASEAKCKWCGRAAYVLCPVCDNDE